MADFADKAGKIARSYQDQVAAFNTHKTAPAEPTMEDTAPTCPHCGKDPTEAPDAYDAAAESVAERGQNGKGQKATESLKKAFK